MRKTIEIVGIGPHKKGVGKNGPYDFHEVAIRFEDKNFDGAKCEVVTIPPEEFIAHRLHVGLIIDAELYQMNFKTRIACFYQ